MNKRVDMLRETNYYMRYSEDLAILESGLSVMSLGDKDQYELSYCLYYRERCAPTCTEHNFWAIRRSLVV